MDHENKLFVDRCVYTISHPDLDDSGDDGGGDSSHAATDSTTIAATVVTPAASDVNTIESHFIDASTEINAAAPITPRRQLEDNIADPDDAA
jgi:hypothetical protein